MSYEVEDVQFQQQLEKALQHRTATILMLHRPENIAYRTEEEFPISPENQTILQEKYKVIIRAHSHVGYDISYKKHADPKNYGTLMVQVTAQEGYLAQIDTDDAGNPLKVTVYHSAALEKNYKAQVESEKQFFESVGKKAISDTIKLYKAENEKKYSASLEKEIANLEKKVA
jgi:hypothetical protein